jgi:hypothetical protein
MNPQYQPNRPPTQSDPFYNPQKEFPNQNYQNIYQNPQQGNFAYMPGSTSKSYIARSNILEGGKPSNNTSAYYKNLNDSTSPPNKFMPPNTTSPTNAYPPNYNGFPGNFTGKNSTELVRGPVKDSNGGN